MSDHHHEICARPGCNCLVPEEGAYCGEWCRAAPPHGDETCACGHPACENSAMFVG